MGRSSLSGLISPHSVALVGASERKGFGYWTAYNLLRSADHVRLYFIHPTRETVLGLPCFRSLQELPEVVDCVVLATRRETVAPLLTQAGELGIRNAMVYASGFSEEHTEEGRRLEEELGAVARRYGMNVLGPNCMGIVNNVDKLSTLGLATAKDAFERRPYIGVAAQSGALANLFMKRAGYPVGYQITTGNATVLAVEDFVEYMVDDGRVRVIAIYLEGIKKPQVLFRALKKAAEKRLPVVALKAGRSAAGAAAASSHTGSLAGSHAAFSAVCRKYGVMEVESMEELMSLAQALSAIHGNLPRSGGVASCNLSGGANILSADCAGQVGVELPRLQPETCAEIAKYIPAYATPANPLDATTDLFGQTGRVVGILSALDRDPGVGLIAITQDIAAQATEIVQGMVDAVVEARRQGVRKPIFFNCITEMDRSLEVRDLLEEHGVGLLPSMPVAYRCLKLLVDYAAYDPARHDLTPPSATADAAAAHALSETQARAELCRWGIPVPAEAVAAVEDDLARCTRIPFPWVMKIRSPDILHKTELGGVRLNVRSLEEARAAYRQIVANARTHMPDAHIEGVAVQETARAGTEFIIGVTCDPLLGPMVLAGMGGVYAEVFRDTAVYPAPVGREQALAMLQSLQCVPLLHGFRGQPPLDVDALAGAIERVSRYAWEHQGELKELDLNPVLVYPEGEGVCAVDALIVRAGPTNERRA